MQKDIFLQSEWSSWFQRNKSSMNSHKEENDKIIEFFIKNNISWNTKTLEIGCSNGWRLNALSEKLWWDYYWIDPGEMAISEWSKSFPKIHLSKSTADDLKFNDWFFDNVIIGFCLYVCDRSDLFKIAYEVDRVLKDWWNIFVLDFDPGFTYKNNYAHIEWLSSYKMDYSKLFLWNPLYGMIYKDVYSHTEDGNIIDPNERISLSVLRKNSKYSYPNCFFHE